MEDGALYQIKCYRRIIVLSTENVTEGTMTEEERMTIDERRKYLHKMRLRYWQAEQRSERSRLLDEMEKVTELHRKSLLRLIHGDLARKPRRKQRGKRYGNADADSFCSGSNTAPVAAAGSAYAADNAGDLSSAPLPFLDFRSAPVRPAGAITWALHVLVRSQQMMIFPRFRRAGGSSPLLKIQSPASLTPQPAGLRKLLARRRSSSCAIRAILPSPAGFIL
jgi:hypothetical protein